MGVGVVLELGTVVVLELGSVLVLELGLVLVLELVWGVEAKVVRMVGMAAR